MSLKDIFLCSEKADLPPTSVRGVFLKDVTFWYRLRCEGGKHCIICLSFESSHADFDLTFCLQCGTKLSTKTNLNCQSDIFPHGPQGSGPNRSLGCQTESTPRSHLQAHFGRILL